MCITGRSTSVASRSQPETSGESRPRYAAPSAPSRAAVSSTERSRTTAVPSSSGCASGASGWIHSRPCLLSGSPLKNGDIAASGWIAEQTSCTKPGSVSSAERAPPPISSFASYTATELPARAIWIAAARPLGPAPTTTASGTQQVAVEPLPRATHRVDHVLARAEAVSFTLVHVVLVHLARGAQRGHDLLCLRQRYARVVLALEDQQRRFDLRDMRQRRAVAIALGVVLWIAELAHKHLAQVAAGRVVHRLPGHDADDRDAGRPTVRVHRERHERHESAVAAAIHADTLWIGNALLREPVEPLHDVLEILPGPVLAIRLLELAAVAGRPADVRSQNDVAAIREPLAGAVPPAVMLARRTTVYVHDRRRRSVAAQGLRVRDVEECGDLATHGPGIPNVDRLDQRLRIDARGQRTRES